MQKDYITGEVVLINKPLQRTSFQVVHQLKGALKRYLGIKKIKIGHAGTLDPLATGLLIICTGKETKSISKYQEMEKEYTGTFFLGATTPGYDKEKEIDRHYPTEHITEDMIYGAVKELTGYIQQVAPLYSAKKIAGERAYDIARRGDTAVVEPKEVHVKVFEITGIRFPEVDFRVICSKGTYIRSLARDIGEKLESGAHLTALCRTRIGNFTLEQSITPFEFGAELYNESELT